MRIALLVLAVAASGCGDNLPTIDADPALDARRVFRTEDVAGCTWASPIRVEAGGESRIVIATTEGQVVAYDLAGARRWQLALPPPPGGRAHGWPRPRRSSAIASWSRGRTRSARPGPRTTPP